MRIGAPCRHCPGPDGDTMDILGNVSPARSHAPESGIVELVNYARDRDGLIPLWVGEGDLPTPAFIRDAADERRSGAGETFYTWQRGIPELREALSRYYTRHFGQRFSPGAFLRGRLRHAGDPARRAGAGLARRRGRLPDAGLAESRRRRIDPAGAQPGSRAGCEFADGRWPLDLDRLAGGDHAAAPRRCSSTRRPTRPAGPRPRRTCKRPCWRWPASAACGSSPTRSTRCYYYGGGRAPSFLDMMEDGRPRRLRQFLLQELVDDRLACRLDRGAAADGPGDREPRAVFHLGRGPVHADAARSWRSTTATISCRPTSTRRRVRATCSAMR